MKKLKSSKKLNLTKSTVSKLNESQLEGVNGGQCSFGCDTYYSMCTYTATFLCTPRKKKAGGNLAR